MSSDRTLEVGVPEGRSGGRYGMRVEQYSALMSSRVRQILVVASRYDSFLLEEEGQLAELLAREYRNLEINIRHVPRFMTAASGAEALEVLASQPVDMVVATARLPDMSIWTFGETLRAKHPGLTFGVLVPHAWEIPRIEGLRESGAADWVFLWQGDVTTLLAMIEQEEDRRNADRDVLEGGVRVIIVVEDDIRFLSFFLPNLYSEVTRQTSRLMAEGLNLSHRLLRLQARPKILLARTFEEAWVLWQRYRDNALAVFSDVAFPRAGALDQEAGLELARRVREQDPDMAFLLHSSEPSNRMRAEAAGVAFVDKNSPELIDDLRRFMLESLGFGDFVFRLEDLTEVARASNLRELVAHLATVPDESIDYHARHNQFSRWFAARTEFGLAALVRPRKASEFKSVTDLRRFLSTAVERYLREIQSHIIADFDVERFDRYVAFARIGSGALGGKGRGLAFLQRVLAEEPIARGGLEVAVPQTVVVATDVFEGFLEANGLQRFGARCGHLSDGEILNEFRAGRFDRSLRARLARYLQTVTEPIAVRSSSLLEDSPYQPFAGVYATIMLPNNHPSLDVRLAQLLEAIKVVYASTYMKAARDYLETTPHRIDEERMGVLLQALVGSRLGHRHFPLVSGVAASYNFYPFRDMQPEDGVVLLAAGLGKAVVEGFEALRVCPVYPQVLPQFSSVKDVLKNAQRRFWALDLARMDVIPGLDLDAHLVEVDVAEVFDHPAISLIASSYRRENDKLVDGVAAEGVPLVTFSRLLGGRSLPFAEALAELLATVQANMGMPVEIELAMEPRASGRAVLHVLQVRPMVVEAVGPGDAEVTGATQPVVVSPAALGHGRHHAIHDAVVVCHDLDRATTPEVAIVVAKLDRRLREEGRPYLLVGPGRWGSRDPWLGIPVIWPQICGAGAIVETDFADLEVEPSQGSHFFHNLTSLGVPYLPVHRRFDEGSIDWEWLLGQPVQEAELDGKIRHLRFDAPLSVVIDGAVRRGLILRPE